MANLRDIKRRITSVQSTQKITSAMKMVAAAKLRRAQDAIGKDHDLALAGLVPAGKKRQHAREVLSPQRLVGEDLT